jgi:hypothetical protein
MLLAADLRPFSFAPELALRLRALLGARGASVLPLLELQVRAYEFREARNISDRFFGFLNRYKTLGPSEVAQQLRRHQKNLVRLAKSLSDFLMAADALGHGDVWDLYNEARGYPTIEREEDKEFAAWLRDLEEMRDVALEKIRKKRKPGPRWPARSGDSVLEHRVARILSEQGVGRASTVAIEVFALVVEAVTRKRPADPKRALARAHKSPLRVLISQAEANALMKRAEQRARVRGFL